jgi:hypothetical protein
MAGADNALLQLFAKHPREGEVKTRLQADIGARAATRVYLHCLQHSLNLLDSAANAELWLNQSSEHPVLRGRDYRLQQGASLGEKMYHALTQGLQQHSRVILFGSDCIDLQRRHISQAERRLDQHQVVLIPALDGGYVLIGVRDRVSRQLFEDIDWSTQRVLHQTIDRARQVGVDVCVLNPLRDIDHSSDLQHYPALTELLD